MTDTKDQRLDQVNPAVQAIDDAIELFEIFRDPLSMWSERDRRAFELAIIALRYIKGSFYDY